MVTDTVGTLLSAGQSISLAFLLVWGFCPGISMRTMSYFVDFEGMGQEACLHASISHNFLPNTLCRGWTCFASRHALIPSSSFLSLEEACGVFSALSRGESFNLGFFNVLAWSDGVLLSVTCPTDGLLLWLAGGLSNPGRVGGVLVGRDNVSVFRNVVQHGVTDTLAPCWDKLNRDFLRSSTSF